MSLFPFSHPHRLSTQLWKGCRIGLLGGSFNPAHEGHLFISELALRLFQLDQVWWLVSPQNPLKGTHDMAALSQRIQNAERFISDHPRLLITSIESEFLTTYTARTLRQLRLHFPQTRFLWIMGTDNLAQIPRWRDWEDIFRTTPVAVMTRTPYAMRVLNDKAARRFRRMRMPPRKLSERMGKEQSGWTYTLNFSHPASATALRLAKRWPIEKTTLDTQLEKDL